MDHLDGDHETRQSDMIDSSAALEHILDHVEVLQSRLNQVTSQLDDLQRRNGLLCDGLQELNHEVRCARRLQHELLPRVLPQCHNLRLERLFLPARDLSGDMYDVVRLDDDRLAISISDATGHGLVAAMIGILTRRSLQPRGEPPTFEPDALLQRLNRELVEFDLSECEFVTSTCGVYDQRNRTLTWSRGGMPYPLIVRGEATPSCLVSEGGLVGVLPDQRYELVTTEIGTGDMVVLYSDGLEALLLNCRTSCRCATLLDTPWCRTLKPGNLEDHLSDIRALVQATPASDWPVDDITILALHGV